MLKHPGIDVGGRRRRSRRRCGFSPPGKKESGPSGPTGFGILFWVLLSWGFLMPVSGQTKLLRFPDIHGDRLVFCHAGDLWLVPVAGGVARRLTAHRGQELFPKFSPDGEWIAFTGQYDGDEQVYVMPSRGGVPRQLTYYPARGPLAPRWGYDNQVYGWTPEGRKVLFRSLRDADGGRTETALYTVDLAGGLPERLPMPSSGAGDFSPDGRRLVYSPLFRDFRTWKRYQGGWAQDLYVFDLSTHATRRIAASRRSERDPMWIGERIYFASDRVGTLNLYAYDIDRDSVEQLTHSSTWDVRWPSSDRTQIVYELNGELEVYDLGSHRSRRVFIRVPDDGLASRPSRYPVEKNIEDFGLSPRGQRALFVARGDVFTVPVEKGPTRNLTGSSDAHDKHARWSPDGRKIAFVSDLSGEEQIHVINQDGSGEAEQVTSGVRGTLFAPEWSPDSRWLAFSNHRGQLYVLNLEEGEVQEIADDEMGRISDYAWSPDSGWLAFSMGAPNYYRALHVWSARQGTARRLSRESFNEYNPVWGPEGDYLYFLSDREFAPQISLIEWNFAGNRTTGIFALALRQNVPHLFPPRSDEAEVQEDSKAERNEKGEESSRGREEPAERQQPKTIAIEFADLEARVIRIPVEADNLSHLGVTPEGILYRTSGPPYYGRSSERKAALYFFDLKKRESRPLADDVSDLALSADGSKVLVKQQEKYLLYEVKANARESQALSTEGLKVDRIPAQEWAQIFDEMWRRYRDYFYVSNMHGYDWKAIGERYRALLPHVAHRSDLNYLLGEMIAELNVGHAYIMGGDFEIPERPKVALPGARFVLDPEANRYRISRIFRGHNQEEKYRAPLTEVGVSVEEGEYVLAIDGQDLPGSENPYRLLQHKTDPVSLTVNSVPAPEGAREVQYRPIFDESDLLYLDWVTGNRTRVEQATEGRVGYLHLPDMQASGIYEFIKWYYPQIRKEGLIVDVRSNGGGNVSEWIIERLDNRLLGTRFGYSNDKPHTYPVHVFHGHKVCLINETSASDGDIFPHRFRKAGLGPLIGKRTWGGVVGVHSLGPLIDGGSHYVPLMGTNDTDGSWIIEGEGVIPDIEVENDPAAVIAGHDPQLERAIQEVMRRIREEPMPLPARPPDPVKTP